MKKDAYYFPHFSNARNDSKVVKLRRVMGVEGYGLYFMMLEVLREQTDFKLPLTAIEDLAYEWHTSKEKLVAVVTNFDLFTIVDDMFISLKLITYLQPYLEKSERARIAANKRWGNANAYANALPEHSKSNTSKVKESKVKESKVKEDIKTKFDFKKSLSSLNIKEQIISDWLIVRKNKKAANTLTAFNGIKKQIELSGKSANECITLAVENNWAGFKNEWLVNAEIKNQPKLSKNGQHMRGLEELANIKFDDDEQ